MSPHCSTMCDEPADRPTEDTAPDDLKQSDRRRVVSLGMASQNRDRRGFESRQALLGETANVSGLATGIPATQILAPYPRPRASPNQKRGLFRVSEFGRGAGTLAWQRVWAPRRSAESTRSRERIRTYTRGSRTSCHRCAGTNRAMCVSLPPHAPKPVPPIFVSTLIFSLDVLAYRT